jgi:hypothetical protein
MWSHSLLEVTEEIHYNNQDNHSSCRDLHMRTHNYELLDRDVLVDYCFHLLSYRATASCRLVFWNISRLITS